MSVLVQLDDIRRAREAQDLSQIELLIDLTSSPDPQLEQPIRKGALTFDRFLQELRSPEFRRKSKEEQAAWRTETLKSLEADDAEVPLSDRLQSHEIILEMWRSPEPADRRILLGVLCYVPLVYGPWRAFKQIFKEAEAKGDTEVLGMLAARFDMALASRAHSVSGPTIAYLCRRAWRYFRQIGERLPAAYPDAVSDVLARYNDDTNWSRTWIANHIFYHETGDYGRTTFRFRRRPSTLLKYRAFAEAWRRSPRPLFSLLERAESEQVRKFATSALKTDFRATLRDVEAVWVARLVEVDSATCDDFVTWVLDNVPRFEQSAFRELGLHDAVLRLFDSNSSKAQTYAADYARTHARDLSVDRLIQLVDNDSSSVSKMARDLLRSLDPRKELGLDACGRLLETESGNQLAERLLREHFGASELTPEWFQERLTSGGEHAVDFSVSNLEKFHATKKLGVGYFAETIERLTVDSTWERRKVVHFLTTCLSSFSLDEFDIEVLKRLLINPLTRTAVVGWVGEGRIKSKSFPVAFLKNIAFHPDWEADPWVADLKKSYDWARELNYDEWVGFHVREWLADVREFSPSDLGFDWLMKLVQRSDSQYHSFATDVMIKAFLPADFAEGDAESTEPEAADDSDDEINIDLGGATFVFTGKLATMTRGEAQAKVTKAGGANSGSVTKKLNYLVIGDEGSPMYGQGRKGSKQLKAEKLVEDGSEMRIISETAFLQMLAGEQREFSEDAVQAGCERLWSMFVDSEKPDEPLAKFAYKYIRRHHPEICLKETDRPVDPGAEMPADFMSFDRFLPLFSDRRTRLREFAMEIAKWEFARWSPPIEGIIAMCESPYPEVRSFVGLALTADDSHEHRRYRIAPDILTADAVYSFCESRDEGTRELGMELISRNPRLRLPEELFRLTESPDRKVRGFVIRELWSLYRDRGITSDWKPDVPKQTTVGSKAKKVAKETVEKAGTGAPSRPVNRPASDEELNEFLRRILFEIPPGRPPKEKQSPGEIERKLKPLPARKAKLLLIETLRDLAVADNEFATLILPLLTEFMASRGKSEMESCLVAVTRIRAIHRVD